MGKYYDLIFSVNFKATFSSVMLGRLEWLFAPSSYTAGNINGSAFRPMVY